MPEVFKRAEMKFGGSFAAEKGIMSGDVPLGILMQNITLQYSQTVTRLYELGKAESTAHFYYVGGRSQGQCTIGHVAGPTAHISEFYKNYGDVCSPKDLQIKFGQICEKPIDPSEWKLKSAVLVNVGMSIAAQDLLCNIQSTLMFTGLEVIGGGGGGAAAGPAKPGGGAGPAK